jgi:ketosteroid isomerase-like protein
MAAGAGLPTPLLANTGKPAKDLVATYAAAWARKDLDAIVACMDEGVQFVGPNVKADGRAAYRASTERFLTLVERVDVRVFMRSGNRAMLAYDFVCRDPIGTSPVAELVHISGGRILNSEIFFDTAPFAASARAQHS